MTRIQGRKPRISIREFIDQAPGRLGLDIVFPASDLDSRYIDSDRIQKLGLALTGYSHYIHKGRLQIIGQSETSYLKQLDKEERSHAVGNLDLEKICCVLITKGLKAPKELMDILENRGVPVLRTPSVSSVAIAEVSSFLQNRLAPSMTMPGVLLGMFGLGVLIVGESGIGKSECALDLITKGYRLISDDAVIVKRVGDLLEGSAPPITGGHLEIRGLGILNIRDLFGVSATGASKSIDVCIELKRWDRMPDVDRLGFDPQEEEIFGVRIPKFVLPVSSGRNLTTLVETAVRIHLLKTAGSDAARKLIEEHSRALAKGGGD